MRILVDGMPRFLGGIGTLIINLVDYNEYAGNKEKIVFDFLVPENSAYIPILNEKNYKYYEMPKVCTRSYRRCLREVFTENRYDCVWINNTSKVNIFLPSLAKKSGALVIVHSHGVKTEAIGLKKIAYSCLEFLQKNSYTALIDVAFACSKASAAYFYSGTLLEQCKIISNGIDVDRFLFDRNNRQDKRKELNIYDNEILLGTVGRISKVKNYGFLVELIQYLPANYKLVILGDGEETDMLQKLICTLQVEKQVLLPGKKKDVEKYLSAMDIFVMPSLNEGMPFSLVEAQANGLKCVVSDGVSDEAKIINTTKFISLENRQGWIEEIQAPLPSLQHRMLSNEEVIKAGYSIKHSYEEFMCSILEKRKYEV